MRKRFKVVLLVIILMMISSVFVFSQLMTSGQDFKKLNPPENNNFELKGEWKIVNSFNFKEKKKNTIKEEYVYFDTDRIFINNKFYDNVSYKLRVVNLKSYLKFEYNIDYKMFIEQNKEVDLISPLNNNTLIGEMIKIEDRKLLVIVSDIIYTLVNVSDDISSFPISNSNSLAEESNQKQKSIDTTAGIYLGIKKQRQISDEIVGQEEYRTLWIAVDNGNIRPVYERSNILYPRLKGFWELTPERINKDGTVLEYFNTHEINSSSSIQSDKLPSIDNKNKYLDLNFISNNYISTEEFIGKYDENYSKYKIVPVDNIHAENAVSIDVLAGTGGYDALKNSSEIALSNVDNIDEVSRSKDMLDPTNIAVLRKNGRWVLEGRTKIFNDKLADLEFDINMINTEKFIFYDNLYVRWNIIKSQNPLIKDVYTSPNQKVAIIILDDYILVYEIENLQLKGEPIKTIKKDKSESVIMAEWTTGDIVDKWEKVFIQDAKQVN